MKTIAALAVLAVTGVAVAGCQDGTAAARNAPGTAAPVRALDFRSATRFADSVAARQAATGRPATTPGSPVRFRTVDYSAVVSGAGGPDAYTVFVTVAQTSTIQPSSAAMFTRTGRGGPIFTSPADKARWKASGSPPEVPHAGTFSLPAGEFSFIPQGAVLTYQQAVALPAGRRAFAAAVLEHLRPNASARPPAALLLKALAYLIADAPLAGAARAAAWRMLAALPGLRLCAPGPDLIGRHGQGLCAGTGGDQTAVLADRRTGTILAVADRLRAPSPLYPMVPAGALIGERAFLGS